MFGCCSNSMGSKNYGKILISNLSCICQPIYVWSNLIHLLLFSVRDLQNHYYYFKLWWAPKHQTIVLLSQKTVYFHKSINESNRPAPLANSTLLSIFYLNSEGFLCLICRWVLRLRRIRKGHGGAQMNFLCLSSLRRVFYYYCQNLLAILTRLRKLESLALWWFAHLRFFGLLVRLALITI